MGYKRERYWVHSDPTAPANTSPSHHGSTKPICVVCHRPYRDAYLCDDCTHRLTKDLGDIPGLADDLEISRTRQNVNGARNGSRSTSKPLPWDERATKASMVLRNELVGLVRDLDPKPIVVGGPVCILCHHESCAAFQRSTWPADTAASMARWLLRHVGEIRQHPAADEIVHGVHRTVKAVQWVIDRRPDRWYAGPCRHETPEFCCVADLYAEPGADYVSCQNCDHRHSTTERKAWLLAFAEDLLETAATISRALTSLDRPVTPDRIRKWAERGRLVPHGVTTRGYPTYRIGDVLDRLAEYAASAERRARKADRPVLKAAS